MKLKILVALIIQLMAIHFLLSNLATWGPAIVFGSGVEPRAVIYFGGILFLAVLVCAFASTIAQKLIAEDVIVAIGALPVVDAYTIPFLVVGLICFLGHLGDMVWFCALLFKNSTADFNPNSGRLDLITFLRIFIPPIVGIAFLINARNWAQKYMNYQKAVSTPADLSKDQ